MRANADVRHWRCPLCNRPIHFCKLEIDNHQSSILTSVCERTDVDEICVDINGQWKLATTFDSTTHSITTPTTTSIINNNTNNSRQQTAPANNQTIRHLPQQTTSVSGTFHPQPIQSLPIRRPPPPANSISMQQTVACHPPPAKRSAFAQTAFSSSSSSSSSLSTRPVSVGEQFSQFDSSDTSTLDPLAAIERTVFQHEQQMGVAFDAVVAPPLTPRTTTPHQLAPPQQNPQNQNQNQSQTSAVNTPFSPVASPASARATTISGSPLASQMQQSPHIHTPSSISMPATPLSTSSQWQNGNTTAAPQCDAPQSHHHQHHQQNFLRSNNCEQNDCSSDTINAAAPTAPISTSVVPAQSPLSNTSAVGSVGASSGAGSCYSVTTNELQPPSAGSVSIGSSSATTTTSTSSAPISSYCNSLTIADADDNALMDDPALMLELFDN